jgi:Pyruvate/2-oxoacid:ferredoxin oxidoreductase gamma subunit
MKMTEDLIIAGFGGQGVMKMGQLIAYSGLEEGKNVLWVPAYGPETRGGFANCTVIVSDSEIGSHRSSKTKIYNCFKQTVAGQVRKFRTTRRNIGCKHIHGTS